MIRSYLVLLFSVVTLGAASPAARAQAAHEHVKAPTSTELKLTIDGKATIVTMAEIAALPQKTVTVHNEHTKTDEIYTGVPLGDLLAKYGFAVEQATHRKMLHSYIRVEGTDKYWVLYSVTEIESSEHNAEVIVATTLGGKPLGDDGQLKLVAGGDKKPERWVRNLTAVTLITVE